jgi:hypothetical protein
VNVTEGHIPERVLCSATAYPEATYQWKHESGTFITKGNNALILSSPVSRTEGGNYSCEAINRHGKITQKTFINVFCKYTMFRIRTQIIRPLLILGNIKNKK